MIIRRIVSGEQLENFNYRNAFQDNRDIRTRVLKVSFKKKISENTESKIDKLFIALTFCDKKEGDSKMSQKYYKKTKSSFQIVVQIWSRFLFSENSTRSLFLTISSFPDTLLILPLQL